MSFVINNREPNIKLVGEDVNLFRMAYNVRITIKNESVGNINASGYYVWNI